MKNKGIFIFIVVLVAVIVVVLIFDSRSGKIEDSAENPYEYNYDAFKEVDEALLRYKEVSQIKLSFAKPSGLAVHQNRLFLTGDQRLQVIDTKGIEFLNIDLLSPPKAIAANEEYIAIAFEKNFEIRTADGIFVLTTDTISKNSVLTSISMNQNMIYVADAGQRKVMVFDMQGILLREIEGVSGAESLHGFIVPSANFDLAINKAGELWVVNPGMHAIQHYGDKGELINFWKNSSMKIDGFSGCCNPANFTFLPNGHFITSEKGLVRIKEYDEKGTFIAVVAAPNKFEEEGKSPDVCCNETGNVYALDKDKKLVRIFEPKKD